MSRAGANRAPRAYADPYLTGALLGVVLLAAFVVVGRGLGASGAFASVAAGAVATVAPDAARANAFFADHLGNGVLKDWLVLELLGVMLGGWLSAALAGRLAVRVERGAHASVRSRLALALAGGSVMGIGAVLARGCTSGQALTGGALLSVGSWTFIAAAFASAYAIAFATRRSWT